MKISLRILLINFVIVAIVFLSSTFVYYSLTKKMIVLQHSRSLLNAANDFILNYESELGNIQESFIKNKASLGTAHKSLSDSKEIDFLFRTNADSFVDRGFVYTDSSMESEFANVAEFKKVNPNAILLKYQEGSRTYYYGRILSRELIDNISRKIRSEVVLMNYNAPVEISNYRENEKYILNIIDAFKKLRQKDDFGISIEELESSDFYATYISSDKLNISDPSIKFLLFSRLPEAAELRSNIMNLLWIIGLAGVALSMILVMLFTEKIRRQITQLSTVAEQTRSGNLSHRANIITKDEIGKLAGAFDNMLDELERNEISKNEFTEFIALINQNPTLSEISEASLNKIINSINFTVGRLSLYEDNRIKLLSSYGLADEDLPGQQIDLYNRVIQKSEILEFEFSEEGPYITTGIVKIQLKYLLIYPIIYNHKTLAILELGAIYKPDAGIKEYLNNIHDQLAIGLTNANTYRKLRDSVNELKKLNDEYQKQNEQISEQNQKLLELHKELKENADELNIQKTRAEEGAVLKSQFLASISHELKTPLNSIIGLTELLITDTPPGTASRDKLKVVLRNGNRLMNLINDILSFSKMEAGKLEIEKENFRVQELICEIESEIQPLTIDKKLNFIVHNEITSAAIFSSDKKKILQVLINLLSNAVKFTERGMIILKCTAIDHQLKFEIIDSGIGISDDDKKLIFEEFRQIDGALSRKYNGSGLGLAISKRYAQMLNGELFCISEPGKGSTFTFVVPVEVIKGVQELHINQDVHIKRNIILLDNTIDKTNIVSQYLTSKNFNVISSNRDNCIQDAGAGKPFAIACNYSTDKQRTWPLIVEIASTESTRQVPFILYTIMDDMNIGYGLPVFSFITKKDISSLPEIISKYEKLTSSKTERVVHLTDSDDKTYKGCCSVNVQDLKITSKLFTKSDIIIIDLLYLNSNAVEIIYHLKESVITRDLPVIISVPENLSEEDIISLNESFERSAVKSKGYPIDVLKVFRDRLHIEDGMPYEDTSSIWVDSTIEKQISEESEDAESKNKNNDKHLVLIVDDDTDTLFTVGEIVRRAGCNTIFAKNGIECLSILKTMTPDLILLDIMMPKMDGFETIKRIRSDKHLYTIPVYAMTAQAMIEEKEIIIKNGFSDFIPKPVNPASLSFKVKKALLSKPLEIPDEENISN